MFIVDLGNSPFLKFCKKLSPLTSFFQSFPWGGPWEAVERFVLSKMVYVALVSDAYNVTITSPFWLQQGSLLHVIPLFPVRLYCLLLKIKAGYQKVVYWLTELLEPGCGWGGRAGHPLITRLAPPLHTCGSVLEQDTEPWWTGQCLAVNRWMRGKVVNCFVC